MSDQVVEWKPQVKVCRIRFVCGRDHMRDSYRIGLYWGRREDPQNCESVYLHALVFHWVWMTWLERS
jgi:hypothetical protein